MVEEDHQDVHESLGEYVAAKSNIARHQDTSDLMIVHPTNNLSQQVALCSPARKLRFGTPEAAHIRDGVVMIANEVVCHLNDTRLVGHHNADNICAAVSAASQLGAPVHELMHALTQFRPLEHRLEFVREVHGVRYYNDSFATTPSATLAALEALPGPKILLLGGSAKRAQFNDLARNLSRLEVKRALVFGRSRGEIARALDDFGFNAYEVSTARFEELVQLASTLAHSGDTVLLSPACASVDGFANARERGDRFKGHGTRAMSG